MNAKRHSHAFDPCHVARQTWYANCCIDTQQKTAVISELRIISRSNLVRVNSFGPVKFIMRVSYSVLKFRITYSSLTFDGSLTLLCMPGVAQIYIDISF